MYRKLLNIVIGALLIFKIWFIPLNNDHSIAGRCGSILVLHVSITKRCRYLETSTGLWLLSKSDGWDHQMLLHVPGSKVSDFLKTSLYV